jgi:mannose-6-phosphate isomerase-like protein (cupin superfamily)
MKVQTCLGASAPALVLALVLGLACGSAALAQSAAPPAAPAAPLIKTFTSSAELTAMLAKADKDRKPGQANFNQPVLSLAPYRAVLESRVAPTPPLTHTNDAEILVIVDGSATFVVGGALVDGKPSANGANISGTAITGGTSMKIAKGDWVIVPENTPHWFQVIDGKMSMVSLHLPRGQK